MRTVWTHLQEHLPEGTTFEPSGMFGEVMIKIPGRVPVIITDVIVAQGNYHANPEALIQYIMSKATAPDTGRITLGGGDSVGTVTDLTEDEIEKLV